MTKPKQISKSLKCILDDELVVKILDRNERISSVADEVLSHWDYDLEKRKAGLAYDISPSGEEMEYCTLDLATFLYTLRRRNAVISLPTYQSRRPRTIKENEVLMSKDNRHGQILNLTSNQNTFSFGIRIKDLQVLSFNNKKQESSGGYRTFLITDFNGEMYEGWTSIKFVPDAKENNFLHECGILDNTVKFKYFIDPNRWISFYGKPYFMLKLLEMRLSEETKHIKKLIADMLAKGIKYPKTEEYAEYGFTPFQKREKGKSEKVDCFEVEIDVPENDSKYPEFKEESYTQNSLVNVTKLNEKLLKDLASARFSIRTVEYAFSLKHKPDSKEHVFPSWIKDTNWEDDKIKRTVWKRLKLVQPSNFERSVAIRYRWYEKSEQVKDD